MKQLAWIYQGDDIQTWIANCEADYCDARKQAISRSGCIEALDNFNNSLDVGFDLTPAPFDRPGPAQPGDCQDARGDGNALEGGKTCGCR